MSDLIPIHERVDKAIDLVKEMEDAFLEIQQPRTAYVLEKFVVGQHDHVTQSYAQCVLELQVK